MGCRRYFIHLSSDWKTRSVYTAPARFSLKSYPETPNKRWREWPVLCHGGGGQPAESGLLLWRPRDRVDTAAVSAAPGVGIYLEPLEAAPPFAAPGRRSLKACLAVDWGRADQRVGVRPLVAGIIGAGRSWTVWMISVLSIPRR